MSKRHNLVSLKKVKLNRYVRAVKLRDHNSFAFYNLIHESLVLLHNELATAIIEGDTDKLTNEELETLTNERILTGSDENEEDELLSGYNACCESREVMSVTICVTTRCNLECKYCFQQHGKSKCDMSTQVAHNVAAEIIEHAEKIKAKNIGVTFTGGEPFLNSQAIDIVAESIRCWLHETKSGITFSFDIITNGTLLTKIRVSHLQEIGLAGIQVTIDGPQAVHDKRRPKQDKTGTYDCIIENISTLNVPTVINLVLDDQNAEELLQLLADLANRLPSPSNFDLSFSFRVGVPGHQSPCASPLLKQHRTRLIGILPEVFQKALAYGFTITRPGLRVPCVAFRNNSTVFTPEGRTVYCVNTIENPHISAPTYRTINWRALPNSLPKKCIKCDIVPICFTGCHFENLSRGGLFEDIHCEHDTLASFVDAYVASMAFHENKR